MFDRLSAIPIAARFAASSARSMVLALFALGALLPAVGEPAAAADAVSAVKAVSAVSAGNAVSAVKERRTGSAKVRYEAPTSAYFTEMAADLKARRTLESIADSVNAEIVLPTDLTLIAAECGTINAFYLPNERTVTLCYELVDRFAELHFRDAQTTAGESGEIDYDAIITAALGATEFVMYHEVGHALIHLLELPITGREEDAVDQLATVVLLSSGDEASTIAAMDGAYTFLLQAAVAEEDAAAAGAGQELAFWDEHSLDPQRFYNVTCWIFGSNPEVFSALIEDELIPEARAARCPAEWTQTANSWTRLLAPYARE